MNKAPLDESQTENLNQDSNIGNQSHEARIAKKVEASQKRIRKEFQKEDALWRKKMWWLTSIGSREIRGGDKVDSSSIDHDNQSGSVDGIVSKISGFVDGIVSKIASSMSRSSVAVLSVSVDNLLDWIRNMRLGFSELRQESIWKLYIFPDLGFIYEVVATDAALGNPKQRWELFRVTCDQAQEFLESVKLRIGSKCSVNEAIRSAVGNQGRS
ncbi:mediator of RNA polymerase II transcription subunit 32-like protein [Tanacetum coccineum]